MSHSTDNRMVSLLIPKDLRIGQAIIVGLSKAKHLTQDTDYENDDAVKYVVTGQDLFYMSDNLLKKLLVLPPESQEVPSDEESPR